MKLQFDSHQGYQLEAINSAINLFEGQPTQGGDFGIEIPPPEDQLQIGAEIVIGNSLRLADETLLENLQKVQKAYNATHEKQNEETGEMFGGVPVTENVDAFHAQGMNFSFEMETGTGKTYTYLRTIHALYEKYRFKKFIIVVPSVAIKEGVMKNLQITAEHFSLLYNNPKMDFYLWDSKKRGQAKQFATNDSLQVLVINIDSFAKDSNIINQASDWGVPMEYIKLTHPIVIVDEPQNMETEIRKKAIANLNPLCTLRYSATHKHPYHLCYKLDPVRAYDLGLVKKIEVDSVVSEDGYNEAYVRLLKITKKGKSGLIAEIEIDESDDLGLQRKVLKLSSAKTNDLFELSGGREVYKNGYILDEIDIQEGYITFTNGKIYYLGQKDDALQEDVMKFQIRKTVQNHFEKEKRLKEKGIKVLSLFFIDKVANYRAYTGEGVQKGKFAEWFEEAYREFQKDPRFSGIIEHDVSEVHDGYFAQDKSGSWKDSKDTKGEGGKTKDDERTYELIMKDKERLLDSNTPLRFLFSHSALREGWDNPNVFQICTLNETKSEMKKRQEIGRGLRLPVNAEGVRVQDEQINVLTVIANESYEDFASSLQSEIEEECGVKFTGRIKSKERDRHTIRLKKVYELDENFKDLWERIKHRTEYMVEYTVEDLVTHASGSLKELAIRKPKITNIKVRLDMDEKGISSKVLRSSGKDLAGGHEISIVPDVLSGIAKKTRLTKATVWKVIEQAGRVNDVLVNPQQLIDDVSLILLESMKKLMVDGIKYERIAGECYEMRLFAEKELEEYLGEVVQVQSQEKTLYDHVMVDSSVESRFARDLEAREDVKFYLKLPRWFKIDTPLGGYNPDWAIVFEGDKRIYFVAETKADGEIRFSEDLKIKCGKAHFQQMDDVRFNRVEKLSEIEV